MLKSCANLLWMISIQTLFKFLSHRLLSLADPPQSHLPRIEFLLANEGSADEFNQHFSHQYISIRYCSLKRLRTPNLGDNQKVKNVER